MVRLVIISIVLAVAPANAQPGPEPPDLAKQHFDQGVALFNDGNYPAALSEFEAAYQLRPAAFVHYNIGLTQKALFRYTEAIASIQRFLDEAQTLTPERRVEAEQLIREMKALLADVTITVSPVAASISVDGRFAGTTPLAAPLQLATGRHQLEISAQDHEPQKREVIVTAGVPLSLSFVLRAIPKTGSVRIDTTTPRATVTIDGRAHGPAPVDAELDPGAHLVEVSAPLHQTRRVDLVIVAGQTRRLDLRLDKERVVSAEEPWYRRWYVWTAGAAVLLGGGAAACGVAGCFDKPQGGLEGTLSPGVVPVP